MTNFLLATGILAVSAFLQLFPTLNHHDLELATVPFSFQFNGVQMPAGKYTIIREGQVVTLRSQETRSSAMAMSRPASRYGKPPSVSLLEFRVYGNEHFLEHLWTQGTTAGVALPKSKREVELAKRISVPRSDEIAMSSKRPSH